ncbi:MAG: tRNA (adenosine(37)-N6)-threonylcarbamoyltransferase complex ATPase subunit type 1 TsaE [Acidobacteria bacterium]|nr:MAG: tRNA (adenosine(37)-N6)-threonylcarbamoyltransferase complex ATPase subunit type 1 TsaE [Acidobacteriota bacterium]
MNPVTCATADDLRAWGRQLATQLPPFTILVLVGELGAGKTTLMQGVAVGWGVAREDQIASPTYTLVHEYRCDRRWMLHLDLYRVESGAQLDTLGLEDVLLPPPPGEEKLVAIEWGERLEVSLPHPYLRIGISTDPVTDVRTLTPHWVR